MALYQFKHPETDEIFEEFRPISKRDEPFIAPDGVKCERLIVPSSVSVKDNSKEVWDYNDFRGKSMPKYVRYRDGHREKYNQYKHF